MTFSAGSFAGSGVSYQAIASLPYMHGVHGGLAAQRAPNHPDVPQTWTVQNCTDHNPDSLRDILQNPTKAKSGDTVDLSQLPTLCNSRDSTITLTTGEILVAQDQVTLQGPDAASGTVTISGGGASRVLRHLGAGYLTLDSLTLIDGYNHVSGDANGGCVDSAGSVSLKDTTIAGCVTSSDTGRATGGGLYAASHVEMLFSTVSGNTAIAPTTDSYGGGIRAYALNAKYSSISDNAATPQGRGGGAWIWNTTSIFASTIDGNNAFRDGGLFSFHLPSSSLIILNSTISGNAANFYAAAESSSNSVTISNSTIAFNHSTYDASAVYLHDQANASLQSSIIANNTNGAGSVPADLYVNGLLSGSDNLVTTSNVSPPGVITVTADPKLGALQFNGGLTRTHALLPGSPALGVGNINTIPFPTDQRGMGYPRTTGAAASVDIGAFQFDTIFSGHFESN